MSKNLLALVADTLLDNGNVKAVLYAIARFAHDDGKGAWPTVDLIAKLSGTSRRETYRVLKALGKVGLVSRCRRRRNSSIYELDVRMLVSLPHYCGIERGKKCGTCTVRARLKCQPVALECQDGGSRSATVAQKAVSEAVKMKSSSPSAGGNNWTYATDAQLQGWLESRPDPKMEWARERARAELSRRAALVKT